MTRSPTSPDEAPATRPGRRSWAATAKGLAIVMVVAFHATLYLQAAGVDAVLGRAKALFELFPMPAFVLIAGLYAVRQQDWAFRDLWTRRLRPLLYLYVLWSALRTVFYLLVPGLNGELGELPATDPLTLPLILFWPSSSYWFLYALFLFTLGAWLLRRVPPAARLALAAAVSTAFSSDLVDTHNLGWNRIGALFAFFVAGTVLARRVDLAVDRARPWHLAVAGVVAMAAAAAALLGLRGLPFLVLTGQAAAVAAGLVAARYLAAAERRVPAVGLLARLGDRSLPIYLLHLYLIVPAVALIGLLDPDWPRPVDVAVQAGLTVAALGGSWLLARWSARLPWLYRPPRWLR